MIAASSLLSSLLLSHPKHFFRLKKHHFPSQGLCCFISIMTCSFMCFIILLLIGISTLFQLLKWDTLVCNSQICLMPLFYPQTDIIATLQFVDSWSFEKRELIAAPQWQVWCQSYPDGSIYFDSRCAGVSAVTLNAVSWDEPSSFISWFSLRSSECHCWRVVCKVWKTPKISRSSYGNVTLKKQVSVWFGVYIKEKLMATCETFR